MKKIKLNRENHAIEELTTEEILARAEAPFKVSSEFLEFLEFSEFPNVVEEQE